MNIYMICTLWTPFQAERDWKNSYREMVVSYLIQRWRCPIYNRTLKSFVWLMFYFYRFMILFVLAVNFRLWFLPHKSRVRNKTSSSTIFGRIKLSIGSLYKSGIDCFAWRENQIFDIILFKVLLMCYQDKCKLKLCWKL